MRAESGAFLLFCAAFAAPGIAQDLAQEVAPASNTVTAAPVLPAGSQIALVTSEELSSKRHRKGDLVTLSVSEDVILDGVTVIPRATPVIAQISQAEKKGLMGRGGKLTARVLYLELPSGPVRLSGEVGVAGKSHTGAATAATAVVSGFAFVISGKSAVIPEGTELVAFLDRDARFPAQP